MRDYADRQVMKRVVVRTVCDGCGAARSGEPPDEWCSFSSYHGEWGNDSIDTHDDHDVCSARCYVAVVRELVAERWPDCPSLVVDGKSLPFLRGLLELG